jgi:hypothetical protein
MGVRNASIGTKTPLNQPIVTTAETVCFTTGKIGLTQDNAQVLISYSAIITLTAGTTALTMRIRRGATATDTVVNVATAQTVAASTTVQVSGCYIDSPGVVDGAQYSLTIQATAAGANSTVNDGCLQAIVL